MPLSSSPRRSWWLTWVGGDVRRRQQRRLENNCLIEVGGLRFLFQVCVGVFQHVPYRRIARFQRSEKLQGVRGG